MLFDALLVKLCWYRTAGLFQCRHQTVKLFCNSRIILNLFTTKYFRCKVSWTPVTFVFLQRCWKTFESDQSYSGLPKAFQSGWLSPITYEWEKDLKTCCSSICIYLEERIPSKEVVAEEKKPYWKKNFCGRIENNGCQGDKCKFQFYMWSSVNC